MKIRTFLTGSLILLASARSQAQPDTAAISNKILTTTRSMIQADSIENWTGYANLVPLTVAKYYGGKDSFIEFYKKVRQRTLSSMVEDGPELSVINLLSKNNEWQCVVRQSRYYHRGDAKYHYITYYIGQSTDDGETWKLFDVSYNTVANIIYMFPAIFPDMPIKEPLIITTDEELAREKAAAQKVTTKKK